MCWPGPGSPDGDSVLRALEDVFFGEAGRGVEQAVAPADQPVEKTGASPDGKFDRPWHGAKILLDRVGGQPHFKSFGPQIDGGFDYGMGNVEVKAVVVRLVAAEVEPAQERAVVQEQGVADQLIGAVEEQGFGAGAHALGKFAVEGRGEHFALEFIGLVVNHHPLGTELVGEVVKIVNQFVANLLLFVAAQVLLQFAAVVAFHRGAVVGGG